MNEHTSGGAAALSSFAPGSSGVVDSIDPHGGLPARLSMLGIRRGVTLDLVQGPDGRGAVVRVGGARVALGREILDRLRLRPTVDAEARP